MCWVRWSPTSPRLRHITKPPSGPALAGWTGTAMLCYVTPPRTPGPAQRAEDVARGPDRYKIAAHAADLARHRPGARDRDTNSSRARYAFRLETSSSDLSLRSRTRREYHNETLAGRRSTKKRISLNVRPQALPDADQDHR